MDCTTSEQQTEFVEKSTKLLRRVLDSMIKTKEYYDSLLKNENLWGSIATRDSFDFGKMLSRIRSPFETMLFGTSKASPMADYTHNALIKGKMGLCCMFSAGGPTI